MPTPLNRAHLLRTIWLTRPDLRALMDDSAEQFDFWCLFHGAREYQGLAEYPDPSPLDRLSQTAPVAHPQVAPPLTVLMHSLWRLRPDLQKAFDLNTAEGQQAFVWWYFRNGVAELNLHHYLDATQMRALMAPHPQHPQVPCILKLLHDADPKLRARFPDPTAAAYRHWASSDAGQHHYPVLARLMQLIGWPSELADKAAPSIHQAPKNLPFGVNLIGYAKGQFGIGEDVRMAALALQAAGIPFSVYNVEPGREVEQNDTSLDAQLSSALPYAINLFCTTGIETARLAATEGSKLFDGRHAIGYWPWELPAWPSAWHHAYELVDEVWASSRFTYHAYAASCPKPVRHLPMAVDVEPSAHLTRQDFGLPPERFLFVFSFDMLSSLKRKNPQAGIQAFRRAFPRGTEPVGLVVKAMRATDDNPLWRELLSDAQADPRIHIIAQTLDRPAVLDLYRACDCYVSLHRSEGFGRGLAEAMLLGKPVIATGYSGNLDFTLPGTAALVDERPVALADGDYPFGSGQTWAEPDIDHAAWWMQHMLTNQDQRQALARAGQQLTAATYAPAAVGARYRQVLARLQTLAPISYPSPATGHHPRASL